MRHAGAVPAARRINFYRSFFIANEKDGLRVNFQIRVPEVTVIDETGLNLGALRVAEAVELAASRGLDLVEVAPQAKPPVCRFLDYGKFKYRKNKKAHEAKKHQKIIRLKEVKLTPRTSEHDYQFKLNHVRRFLADGNKAKVTVFFKGRQIDHTELGRVMLERYIKDSEDFATLGQVPKMEGRTMSIILEPKGKGHKAPVKSSDEAANGTDAAAEAVAEIKEGVDSAENEN